ncbi:MAG: hypothetical protein WAQ52_11435 [Terriglobales bacterium]
MDESSALTRRLDPLNEWQIEEIRKGIDEADRGEFANDEEVRQSLKRWTLRPR